MVLDPPVTFHSNVRQQVEDNYITLENPSYHHNHNDPSLLVGNDGQTHIVYTCRTRVWGTGTYITFCIYLPCNRYRLIETEEYVIHYCGPILNAKFHRERQRYRP